MSPSLWFTVPLAIFPLLVFLVRSRRKSNPPLPPSPPVSGFLRDNRSDVSKTPYKTFKIWNDTYGPVVSFRLGTKTAIVLGTLEAASDLLEKKGEIYSSRPRSIMANELLSGGMRGIGMPYGQRWRRWRTLQQSSLNIQASVRYRPLQQLESAILLMDMLNCSTPDDVRMHLKRFAISVTFCVAYGRRIKSLDDDFVNANQKIEDYFSKLITPGQLVDVFPFLLKLPRFLQFFRNEVDRQRTFATDVYMTALDTVKSQISEGVAQQSMATHAMEKQHSFGMNDLEVAYALSAPWGAGVLTTLSTIEMAILAMLHYPSVMKKIQSEIDNIVGRSRMPEFSDADTLPYLQASVKEVLRWKPIAPSGFPHATTEDDIYKGMFIPKGTIVFANIYAMASDPTLFPNPSEFEPERFLNTEDPRLTNFTTPFGFGRRICPGMHIAQQSVWIVLARLLWTFDVLPIPGEELPSVDALSKGVVRHPVDLRYRLVARHEGVSEIVGMEAERAINELNAWHLT